MCKIDIKFSSDRRQSPVGSIQQGFCGHIVGRPKPFAFEYAPQCFRDVQMWGIWGQEEKEQLSSLMSLHLCILALSNTRKVSFLIRKESRSRKSATLPAVMLSVVLKPS